LVLVGKKSLPVIQGDFFVFEEVEEVSRFNNLRVSGLSKFIMLYK